MNLPLTYGHWHSPAQDPETHLMLKFEAGHSVLSINFPAHYCFAKLDIWEHLFTYIRYA